MNASNPVSVLAAGLLGLAVSFPAVHANVSLETEAPAVKEKPSAKAKRPFLGISVKPVDQALRQHLKLPPGTGLSVEQVVSDSPAKSAGLQPGDVLAKLDDQLLVNAEQLVALVGNHKKGDTIRLDLIREGARQSCSVTVGETDQPEPTASEDVVRHLQRILSERGSAPRTGPWQGWQADKTLKRKVAFLGVSVDNITPTLASQLNLPSDEGVVVNHVVEGSPAAKAGLKVHDLIQRIGEDRVKATGDFMATVRKHKKGDVIKLRLIRAGKPKELEATLDERDEAPAIQWPFNLNLQANPPILKLDKDDLGIRLERSLRNEKVDVQKILDRALRSLQDRFSKPKIITAPAPPHQVIVHEDVKVETKDEAEDPKAAVPHHQTEVRVATGDGSFVIRSHDNQRELQVHDPKGKLLYEGPWNTADDEAKIPEAVRQHLKHLQLPPLPPASPDVKKEIRVVVPKRPGPVI